MRGAGSTALEALQVAVDVSQNLRISEPGNSLWRQFEVKRRYELGTAAMLFENREEGWRQLRAARGLLVGLVATDPTNAIWNIDLNAQLSELEARLLAADSRDKDAWQSADAASGLLLRRTDMGDPVMRTVYGWALLLRGDMSERLGRSAAARLDWSAAAQAISGEDDKLPSSLLTVRFVAAKRLGNTARANALRAMLDQRRWRHPAYLVEAQ